MAGADEAPESPWLRPGMSHVSPWNFHPHVEAKRQLPRGRRVFVTDGTIRAICNSEPGSLIDENQLVQIASTLEEMGVAEIRLAIGSGPVNTVVAQAIGAAGVQVPRCGGIKIDPDSITKLIAENRKANVQRIELEYGALWPRPGFDYTEAAFQAAEQVAESVRSAGFGFSFGFNISPESKLDYMLDLYSRLLAFDPVMYRIYDPFTCCGPDAMAWLVTTILEELGPDCPPLVLHTHNAWGFGAAINIMAVLSGLSGVDVAANAVGNKAGHADFAGTVMGLECLYDVDTGINTELLSTLAYQTEAAMNTPLHPNTPFVGRHVFVAEKGPLALRAMHAQYGTSPDLAPYAAEIVGQKKRVVWGRGSSREVIENKLRYMGLPADDDIIAAIDAELAVRLSQVTSYPVWIEDHEAEAIFRNVVAQRRQ